MYGKMEASGLTESIPFISQLSGAKSWQVWWIGAPPAPEQAPGGSGGIRGVADLAFPLGALTHIRASQAALVAKTLPADAGDVRDAG